MRKPGWCWVKFGKGNDWECKRLVSSGYWASHDGVMEIEPSEVGPRIPTPDEPWQCVPVEPTEPMLQTLHDKVLISCNPAKKTASILNDTKLWGHVLAAAPKPESQP